MVKYGIPLDSTYTGKAFQGMKKYMGDILKWIFHTGISFFHIGSSCLLHFITGGKFPVVFQHGDRAGVIILLCQFFGFFEKCFWPVFAY